MKTWHKALMLGVVTEVVTIAWFVFERAHRETSKMLALLHAPGILLISRGSPWLLAVFIEAALWMLFWFLLLRLFATPKDELTKVTFSGIHSDRTDHE